MGNKQSSVNDESNQRKDEDPKNVPDNYISIPKTMKAAVATGFGEVDSNIFVRDDWPVPSLDGTSGNKTKDKEMLIRVLTCALAPGDPRILSGATDWIQLPKGGHPYVIGSDVAGIVMQVQPDEEKFNVGDYVVSRFELPGPVGGVAEYRIVKTSLSEKCPAGILPIHACGLSASAVAAKKIVQQYMKPNDRVLVIGAAGGVGYNVLQYAKLYGASFIAAVSTQQDRCDSLGVDRVIDYRKEKWWEMSEFQSKDSKFDVVFDLVDGDNWNIGGRSGNALHPRKSTYVSVVPGVATTVHIHSLWDIVKLSFSWTFKALAVKANPKLPRWAVGDGLDLKENELHGVLQDIVEGRLKPVLDPSSPFSFTEEGVRKAMALQESTHAHGKVVIEIAKNNT